MAAHETMNQVLALLLNLVSLTFLYKTCQTRLLALMEELHILFVNFSIFPIVVTKPSIVIQLIKWLKQCYLAQIGDFVFNH